jgi:hypothetical protein
VADVARVRAPVRGDRHVGWAAYARRRVGFAVAAFAALPLALSTIMLPSLEPAARVRSAQPIAESLSELPIGTEVACLDGYPAGLSFYLGRTLTILSDDAKPLRSNFILYWLRHVPVRPPTLVARNERDDWLASRRTDAFVLAPASSRDDLESWLGSRAHVHAVATAGGAPWSPDTRDASDVRDLRRRRARIEGTFGAVPAPGRRLASPPEAPRPRRGPPRHVRHRSDRRDAARDPRA